jgi:uncharacterized protein
MLIVDTGVLVAAADRSGLIALAERHAQSVIATLDHRHFSVVRPEHIDAFTLLP